MGIIPSHQQLWFLRVFTSIRDSNPWSPSAETEGFTHSATALVQMLYWIYLSLVLYSPYSFPRGIPIWSVLARYLEPYSPDIYRSCENSVRFSESIEVTTCLAVVLQFPESTRADISCSTTAKEVFISVNSENCTEFSQFLELMYTAPYFFSYLVCNFQLKV